MRIRLPCFTMAFLVIFVMSPVAAESVVLEDVLDEDEVARLLTDKTITGTYLENNTPFTRYYSKDGTVRQSIEQEVEEGKWLVDKQGRRCVVWLGKEKRCRVIIKDNELYKEFTVQKKGKPKLTVIYNKVVGGNPDNL